MQKGLFLAVCVSLSPAALAQGVVGPVNTARISRSSPAHYVTIQTFATATTATQAIFRGVYPFPGGGRLVDVLVYQYAAGTGGTSVSISVRNFNTVSLLTTAAVMTLASGADTKTDARGNVALPSGWTRPVLKTDATVVIPEGGYIDVLATETGTYSTHPTIVVVLVFEPLQ